MLEECRVMFFQISQKFHYAWLQSLNRFCRHFGLYVCMYVYVYMTLCAYMCAFVWVCVPLCVAAELEQILEAFWACRCVCAHTLCVCVWCVWSVCFTMCGCRAWTHVGGISACMCVYICMCVWLCMRSSRCAAAELEHMSEAFRPVCVCIYVCVCDYACARGSKQFLDTFIYTRVCMYVNTHAVRALSLPLTHTIHIHTYT